MQTVSVHSTSRRCALGQLAGAGTLGAGAALLPAALAVEEDPHLGWERQVVALRHRINTEELDEETSDALTDEEYRLEGLTADTRARTLAGVQAQLRLAHEHVEAVESLSGCEGRALRNAMATLAELAGQGRA